MKSLSNLFELATYTIPNKAWNWTCQFILAKSSKQNSKKNEVLTPHNTIVNFDRGSSNHERTIRPIS